MSIFDGLFGGGGLFGLSSTQCQQYARFQDNANRRTQDMLQQQEAIRQKANFHHAQKQESQYDNGDVIDIEPLPLKQIGEGQAEQL